jgi:hypothetical protein
MIQMPADRFSFAVRVCREIDLGSVFGFFADSAQDVSPAADRDVFQVKIIADIHTELAFRQVADMSLGRFDLVPFSEVFADRFRFRGRLDNDQFLFGGCHDDSSLRMG